MENNKIEIKKTIEKKSIKLSWIYEKINKIDKLLTRLSKKEKSLN